MRLGGDHARQVGAVHLPNAAGLWTRTSGSVSVGRDDAAHHAVGAQMANEGAGVDLGENGNGERSMYSSVTCSERQLS